MSKFIVRLMQMKATIFKQNTNMRYLPYMIHNVTVDICGHLCGNTMSLFFKIYEKPIKQYLHPSCCPFSVSIYQRSNWLIDFKIFMFYSIILDFSSARATCMCRILQYQWLIIRQLCQPAMLIRDTYFTRLLITSIIFYSNILLILR